MLLAGANVCPVLREASPDADCPPGEKDEVDWVLLAVAPERQEACSMGPRQEQSGRGPAAVVAEGK